MRILLISKWIDGAVKGKFHHSGEWIDTFELARAFSDLGNEVIIVTPKPNFVHQKRFDQEFGRFLRRKRITHFFANTHVSLGRNEGSHLLRLQLTAIRVIRECKPDIIQFMQIMPILTFPLSGKIPTFFYGVVLPSSYPNEEKDVKGKLQHWAQRKEPLISFLENIFFRLVAKILNVETANSLASRGVLVLKHKKGYDLVRKEVKNKRNIYYIHKGVNLESIYKKNPGKKDIKNVLYLSYIAYRKGVFDLLKAFDKISQKFPKTRLIIAGTGPADIVSKLKNQVKKSKTKVKFLESVSYQDKWKVFKMAAIFCLPSYADASPSAIMESMASGLPVITTYEADPPFRDNQAGILIRAGDTKALLSAIKKLLSDSVMLRIMAKRGQEIVAKYSWRNQAKKLLILYKSRKFQ